MKSNEEFKAEVFRRRDRQVKARRRKIVTACVSLLLCMALVGVFAANPLVTSATTDLTAGYTGSDTPGAVTDDGFRLNQMNLSLKLMNACYEEDSILISPLSISVALALTANGAEGQTLAEMEALLAGGGSIESLNEYLKYYLNHLPSTDGCKLSLANSIWYRDDENRLTVEPAFLQTNADYYDAALYAAPFDHTTLTDINRWISEKTDGMIPEALEKIEDDAVLYLINALAFDGKWAEPYESGDIQDARFTAGNGDIQTAAMMYSTESIYLKGTHCTGFAKDYQGGDYRFVALLPEEGMTVAEFLHTLTGAELLALLDGAEGAAVRCGLPRFENRYRAELSETLKGLGMSTAFGSGADFSRMGHSTRGPLSIGQVFHETYICVDSEGTKAAASTIVEITDECAVWAENEVILNRPFVYLIVDSQTNLPVFLGAVTSIEG